MEETKDVSVKSVALKYGLINGLIGIIFFVIVDFAGMAGNQTLTWVGIAISAVFIFIAQKEYLRDGDGYMSYGQGLGLGTLLSLVSAAISSVFTYIYVSFVNPAFIDNIREQQVISMEEQGMSDAQIEQAMQMSENFTGPTAMLVFGLIGGVFVGFILSLIISAINKKSAPEFE